MVRPFFQRNGKLILLLFLALSPGIVFLSIFLWRSGQVIDGIHQYTLFDDAMISMTYARTLVENGEWVWFPGAERIQGITNPLWTGYMALLHATGLDGSSIAFCISLTGIVLIISSALVAATLVRYATLESPTSLIAQAIAAGTIPFLYPLAFWTLRGMEVGLLALLTLWMILLSMKAINLFRESNSNSVLLLFGLISVLGISTRLDFSIISCGIIGLSLLWAPSWHARYRIILFVVLPTVIGIACVLIFQYLYWGDWMPNTYRLKVEGYTTSQRLARGLSTLDKVIQFLALVAVALVLAMKQMTRPTRYLITATSSVVIITCVYSTWVGGDAWEWSKCFNRYIAVSLPAGTIGVILAFASSPSHKHQNELLALNANALMFSMSIGLIFAVSMSSLLQPTDWLPLSLGIVFLTFILVFSLHNPSFSAMQRGGISMSAVALLVFITTSAIPGESWLRKNGLHVSDDHALTARSHALNEVTKQEAVIATVWAGAPAYYSRRKMIDLLGKSDRVIAGRPPKGELHPGHNKWDYLYSIGELRPDVVFQLWRHTDEDLKLLQSWGYVLRCNNKVGAVYYLSQSDQVNWEKLQDCP